MPMLRTCSTSPGRGRTRSGSARGRSPRSSARISVGGRGGDGKNCNHQRRDRFHCGVRPVRATYVKKPPYNRPVHMAKLVAAEGADPRPYPGRHVRHLERRADPARIWPVITPLRSRRRGAGRTCADSRWSKATTLLASAKLYRFDAMLDGRAGRRSPASARCSPPPASARPRRGARADRAAARARGCGRRRSRAAVFRNRAGLLRAPRLRGRSTRRIGSCASPSRPATARR